MKQSIQKARLLTIIRAAPKILAASLFQIQKRIVEKLLCLARFLHFSRRIDV